MRGHDTCVGRYLAVCPLFISFHNGALTPSHRHEGYLPDGRSGNYNGLTQGGSNADNVLADAYVKGLRGSINWTDAYAAVLTDAEITPLNDNNPVDPSGSLKEGRSALDDWKTLGYVAVDHYGRAVSKTQEYSVNDFAVAQIAKGEAPGDAAKYLNRSANWQRGWSREYRPLALLTACKMTDKSNRYCSKQRLHRLPRAASRKRELQRELRPHAMRRLQLGGCELRSHAVRVFLQRPCRAPVQNP